MTMLLCSRGFTARARPRFVRVHALNIVPSDHGRADRENAHSSAPGKGSAGGRQIFGVDEPARIELKASAATG